MARVYISSTWLDLQDERAAVADAVRLLGHQPIAMEDYVAADERPLDKCVADVESSEVYIGIFGWRYGYIPPTGDGRSITELEYDAATRAGLPRLIFLADERWACPHRDVDPARVKALREMVAARHTVSNFSDRNRLQTLVTAALARTIPAGVEVPPLLPYLCDRSAQFEQLRTRSRERGTPLVAIVHGAQDQVVDRFVDVVKEDELPTWAPGTSLVREFDVQWPGSARPASLLAQLAVGVCGDALATEPDVIATLAAARGPTLVSIAARSPDAPDWANTVRGVAAFFVGLDLRPATAPLLVLIWTIHPPAVAGWRRWVSFARPVDTRSIVASVEDAVLVLPELPDVEHAEAAQWQRHPRVRAWNPHADLGAGIDALFADSGRLPMRPTAEGLKQVLGRTPRPGTSS